MVFSIPVRFAPRNGYHASRDMIFGSPFYFLLFIPLLILVLWRGVFRKRSGVLFSDVSALVSAPKSFLFRLKAIVPLFRYVALGLLIIALARPQSGREDYRVEVEGIAIMMCIDRSGSMQAVDFEMNGKWMTRLDVVKKTFRDFVLGTDSLPGRSDDKIGLIAFGGFADTFCALTLDHTTLTEMLNSVQLIVPNKDALGNEVDTTFANEERLTAIGDALVEAVARLKDVPAKSKVIILLSDGEQTAGIATPLEGAETAKAYGIKVYTIGIGSTGIATFVNKDQFGQDRITREPVALDEKTLVQIAHITGGMFFNAHNTQTLQNVYAQIDTLEKTKHEGRLYTKYTDHFRLFLWPAIGLLFLHTLLVTLRFQGIGE